MNNLLAALMFFTRLPFHKIRQVPAESFSHVTGWWSVTGWLTGGLSALTFWLLFKVTSPTIAIVMALLVRVLLMGALHEDGLADFLDGFGGGNDKDSTLRIMKDSHIGTYGVIGLILYFLLSFVVLANIHPDYVPVIIISSDVFAKCISSHIVWFLPYARPESESKNRTVYTRPTVLEETLTVISGLAALAIIIIPDRPFISNYLNICLIAIVPIVVAGLLLLLFRKKIGGYTGDCCGALFLITELIFRFMTAIV
jgi:adenosylcobinamide-GDP ribazoletransferase